MTVITKETLYELGRKYDCIKSRDKYADRTEHYLKEVYPDILASYQDKAESVLEIGVFRGASLMVFRDYFTKAHIIGMEIVESNKLKDRFDCEDRVTLVFGDQESEEDLQRVIDVGAPFDIVIDDAGHRAKGQIQSYKSLWPHVKSGGLYIVEDLQHSYQEKKPSKGEVIRFFREKINKIFLFGNNEIKSIKFWPNLLAMEKR